MCHGILTMISQVHMICTSERPQDNGTRAMFVHDTRYDIYLGILMVFDAGDPPNVRGPTLSYPSRSSPLLFLAPAVALQPSGSTPHAKSLTLNPSRSTNSHSTRIHMPSAHASLHCRLRDSGELVQVS